MSAVRWEPTGSATETKMGGSDGILLDVEKQQRGKMAMFPSDHMPKTHEDYTASAPAWEPLGVGSTNLVGGTALGNGMSRNIPLMPLATRVGQMKLDAPPRYGGQRQLGVRIWLIQM